MDLQSRCTAKLQARFEWSSAKLNDNWEASVSNRVCSHPNFLKELARTPLLRRQLIVCPGWGTKFPKIIRTRLDCVTLLTLVQMFI